MSTPTVSKGVLLEQVLIQGDLSSLSDDQRSVYYGKVCESLGLNPLTRPFEYIRLNNKLTLYAKRDATDQLRKIHNVSIEITSRQKIDDVWVVTAWARINDRTDESVGAVNVHGLKGDALANALMKAETKAKRRVTLSICGLGLLDETEVETIPHPPAKPQPLLVERAPVGYLIPYGRQYKGTDIAHVPVEDLEKYRIGITDKAKRDGKHLTELSKEEQEFLEQIDLMLAK
jgi:hypothetical protein